MLVNNNSSYNIYTQLSTGKRINSARDDAAGLAIAKKLETAINELSKGSENAYYTRDLLNIADGGMNSISDALGRIRELTIQAGNGTLTDSDRQIIQFEVDSLKEHITDTTNNTEYNGIKLLDGSFVNKNVMISSRGASSNISIENLGLDNLGITDLDVNNISKTLQNIDKALEQVNTNRASIGGQSNRLDHSISINEISSINQQIAKSRIEDTDMAKAVTEQKKEYILEQYRLFMANKQISNTGSLFSSIM